MSKICPFLKRLVLYLDCLDCDEKKECGDLFKHQDETLKPDQRNNVSNIFVQKNNTD